MIKNIYVEYKKWVPFWGFFIDGQKENQEMLNKYNKNGWRAVQYIKSTFNFSIGRVIINFIISAITLGFMQFWSGDGFLFEKIEKK